VPPRSHHLSEVSSRAYPSLDRNPAKKNWVDKSGGLPSYIERIAKHLHYEKGRTIGAAIATAVETTRRWCSTGRNWNGGNLTAATQAKACKAAAEWEAKKAKSKAKTAAKSMKEAVAEAQAMEPTPAIEILEMYDGNDLGEAVLSYQDKKKLPVSAFAVPGERKYPIHDEAHARNALARVAQHGTSQEKNMVREAVTKRYPNIEISEAEQFTLSQDEAQEIALLAQQRLLAVEGMLPLLREKQTRGKKQIVESASELLEAELTAPFSLAMVGGESAEPKAQKEMAEALADEAEELRALCEFLGLELSEGMDPVAEAESRVEKAKKRSPRDRKKKGGQDAPPWEEDNPKPKKEQKELTPEQKAKAKARAKKAGRKYPNLVDNMAASEMAEGYGYGKMAGMSSMPAPQGDNAEMKRGDEGQDVEMAQKQVMALGSYVGDAGADGKFGSQTEDGVKRVQRKFGLKADGVVGPKTKRVLSAAKVDESVAPMGMNADIVKDRSSDEVLESRMSSGALGPSPRITDAAAVNTRRAPVKNGGLGRGQGATDPAFEKLHPRGRSGQWIVKGIQNELGMKSASGQMDENTVAKIKEFQRQNGLQVDGIVGSQTAAAMMDSSAPIGALTADQSKFLSGRGEGKAGRPLNKRVMEAAEELVPEEVVADEVEADEEAESEEPSNTIEEPVTVVTEETDVAAETDDETDDATEVEEAKVKVKVKIDTGDDEDEDKEGMGPDGSPQHEGMEGESEGSESEDKDCPMCSHSMGKYESKCASCGWEDEGGSEKEPDDPDDFGGPGIKIVLESANALEFSEDWSLTKKNKELSETVDFNSLSSNPAADGADMANATDGNKPSSGRKEPPNLRESAAGTGSSNCGNCDNYEDGKCVEYGVEVSEGQVCDDWSGNTEIAEAQIDNRVRGAIRSGLTGWTRDRIAQIRRLPDGTFAPLGRGRVLRPGQAVSLGGKRGRVTDGGQSVELANGQKVKLAMPAVQQMPMRDARKVAASGSDEDLSAQERLTLSPEQQTELRKSRRGMDSPTAELAKKRDERARERRLRVPTTNTKPAPMPKRTFPMSDEEMRKRGAMDSPDLDTTLGSEVTIDGKKYKKSLLGDFGPAAPASAWVPEGGGESLTDEGVRDLLRKSERKFTISATDSIVDAMDSPSGGWTNDATWQMAQELDNNERAYNQVQNILDKNDTTDAIASELRDTFGKPDDGVNWDELADTWTVDFNEMASPANKPIRLTPENIQKEASYWRGKGLPQDEAGFLAENSIRAHNQRVEREAALRAEMEYAQMRPFQSAGAAVPRMASPDAPDLKDQSINELADLIRKDWGGDVNFAAKPYLDAMGALNSIDDMYGLDSGRMVVAYFLSNARGWKGDTARAVKAELKRRSSRSGMASPTATVEEVMRETGLLDEVESYNDFVENLIGQGIAPNDAYRIADLDFAEGDTLAGIRPERVEGMASPVEEKIVAWQNIKTGAKPGSEIYDRSGATWKRVGIDEWSNGTDTKTDAELAQHLSKRETRFAGGNLMMSPGIDLSKYGKGKMSRDEFNALSEDELRSLWMDVRERESAGGVSPNEASALSQMDGYVVRDRILKMVQKAEDAKPEEQRKENSLLWMWSPGETNPQTKSLVDTLDKGMKFGAALDRAVAKVKATDFGKQDADTLRAIADRLAATQSVDAQKLGQDMRAAAEIKSRPLDGPDTYAGVFGSFFRSPDRFSGMPAESSPAAEAWAEEKVQRDFIEKFMDDNNASEDAAATAFDDWYQSQGWSDAMADAKSEWGSMDSPDNETTAERMKRWFPGEDLGLTPERWSKVDESWSGPSYDSYNAEGGSVNRKFSAEWTNSLTGHTFTRTIGVEQVDGKYILTGEDVLERPGYADKRSVELGDAPSYARMEPDIPNDTFDTLQAAMEAAENYAQNTSDKSYGPSEYSGFYWDQANLPDVQGNNLTNLIDPYTVDEVTGGDDDEMDSPGRRPKVSDVEEWDTVDGGWEAYGIKVEEARKIKDGTYGGVTAESWVNSGGIQKVSGSNIKTKYFYGETAWSDAQRYAIDAAGTSSWNVMRSPVPHYGNGIRRPMGNLRNLHALSDDKLNILRARVLQSGDHQGAKALRAEMGLRGMASPGIGEFEVQSLTNMKQAAEELQDTLRNFLDDPDTELDPSDTQFIVQSYAMMMGSQEMYDKAMPSDLIDGLSILNSSYLGASVDESEAEEVIAAAEKVVAGIDEFVASEGIKLTIPTMDSPNADPFFGFGEEVVVSSPNSPRDGQRGKVVSNRMSMDGKAPLFHYLVEFDDGQEQVVEGHLVTPAEEKADEDSATGRAMLTIVEMMSPDKMMAGGGLDHKTPFLVRQTEISPDDVSNWVRRGRMNDSLDDSSLQRAFDEELAAYALGAYGGLDHQGLASAKFTGLRARRWKLNSAMASPGLPDNYTQPEVDSGELVGTDGNAFAVMGFVTNALRDAGNDQSVVDAYVANATSGDYNHLLQVSMAYLDGDSDAMKSPDVSGQLNAIYGMDQNETLDFPDGIQVERLVDTDELYDAGPTYIVRQGESSALIYGPNKVINNVEERLGLVMASPWTSSGLKVSMADLENFNLGDEYNNAVDEYRRLNRELKKAMDADDESLADDIRYELNDAEETMRDLSRRVTAKEEIDSGEEVLVDANGNEIMLSPSPAVLGGIKGKRYDDRAVFNSPMPNPSPQPSVDEIVQSVLRSEAVGPFRNTVTLPNGTVLQYFYGQGASEGIFTPDEVIRPSAAIEIGDKVQYFYNLSLTRAAEVARDLDAMLDGSGPLDITEVHTAFETLANAESVREREVAAANTLATALGIQPTAINKSVRDANAWQNTAMVLPNTTVPKGTMASPDTTDMDIPEGFQVNTSALEMGEMPNGTLFTMKDGFRYVKHRNTDADEPDKVWVIAKPVDSNGNVIQVDPAFEVLEGQPPKAAHGPTRRILHRRFAPALVGGYSPDYSEQYGFGEGDPQEPGDAVSIAKKFPGQVADAVLDEVAMASPSPAPDGFENKRASSIEVGDKIVLPDFTYGSGWGYGSTKIDDDIKYAKSDELTERGWSSHDFPSSYHPHHMTPMYEIVAIEKTGPKYGNQGYEFTLSPVVDNFVDGVDYVGGDLVFTTSVGKIIARSTGDTPPAPDADAEGLDSNAPRRKGTVHDLRDDETVTAMLGGKAVKLKVASRNEEYPSKWGWDKEEKGPFAVLDAVYLHETYDEAGDESQKIIKATPENIGDIEAFADAKLSEGDPWDDEAQGAYYRINNPYATTLFDSRAVVIDGTPALISADVDLEWQIPSAEYRATDVTGLEIGNVVIGNDATRFVITSIQKTDLPFAPAFYPVPVEANYGIELGLRSEDGSIEGKAIFKSKASLNASRESFGTLEKTDIPVAGKSPAQVSGADVTPEDNLYDLTKKAVMGQSTNPDTEAAPAPEAPQQSTPDLPEGASITKTANGFVWKAPNGQVGQADTEDAAVASINSNLATPDEPASSVAAAAEQLGMSEDEVNAKIAELEGQGITLDPNNDSAETIASVVQAAGGMSSPNFYDNKGRFGDVIYASTPNRVYTIANMSRSELLNYLNLTQSDLTTEELRQRVQEISADAIEKSQAEEMS